MDCRMLGDLLVADGVNVGRLRASVLTETVAIEARSLRSSMSKPVPGVQGLRVYTEQADDGQAQPSLRHRHHRHNQSCHRTKLRQSERCCRLAERTGAGMAAVDQARGRPLHIGLGGSAARFGPLEAFSAHQGSRSISIAFTGPVCREKVTIDIAGRGAWWTLCTSNACRARSNMATFVTGLAAQFAKFVSEPWQQPGHPLIAEHKATDHGFHRQPLLLAT